MGLRGYLSAWARTSRYRQNALRITPYIHIL
jgi:hypothetical protein